MSTSRALTYWWDHGPMRRVIRRGRWEMRRIERPTGLAWRFHHLKLSSPFQRGLR